jgi:hypothetical protein
MEYIKDFVNKFNPDIVIFETVVYNILMFADSVAGIPELLE